MKEENIKKWINGVVSAIEIVLAMILFVGIISAIPDLFKYIPKIYNTPSNVGYIVFEEFIRHALLLVVGLEMILMISTHSKESILTLVLFVIARKLLVYAEGMTDILIGAMAVAVIFSIIIILSRNNKMSMHFDSTFPASMTNRLLKDRYGYDFPTLGAITLGGLMVQLADDQGFELKEKSLLEHGDYIFCVEKLRNGIIEKVRIEEKK